MICGEDPYDQPKHRWSTNPDHFPRIDAYRIVEYFVHGVSYYTHEEFCAHKSMEAYTFFIDGWIRDIRTYIPAGCTNAVVAAKVCEHK